MKREAFTIIELVIAVAIFSIIIVYMYQAVNTTKKGNEVYKKHHEMIAENENAKRVFYNDIFNQVDPYKDISFQDNIFYIRSNNSLHGIVAPYIAYMLKSKNLIRIESLKKIKLPLNREQRDTLFYEVDFMLKGIDDFKVLSKKNSYVVEWTRQNKKTMFQLKLPYYRKVVIVEGSKSSTK